LSSERKKNNPVVSLYPVRGQGVSIVGAGTFISPRVILTCQHVVRAAKTFNVYVWYNEGVGREWDKVVHIKARAIYTCKSLDFALLEVDEDFDHMDVTSEAPLDAECQIICPHRKDSPFKGTLKYNTIISGENLDRLSCVLVGPKPSPGTSGSPLVYEGRLAGLHWGGGLKNSAHLSLCVPFKYIAKKLTEKFGHLLTENTD
jgi:hypothetical protein